MQTSFSRPTPPPAAILVTVLVLLSGAARAEAVFRQDFQSCDSISCYVSPTPNTGQFNDLSAEPDGGEWEIHQSRLQLTRPGISSEDNGAGFTRFTNFAGPPTVLHVSFDFSVAASFFRNNSLTLDIGTIDAFQDYSGNTPSVRLFSRLNVDLRGNDFTFEIGDVESPRFPANGATVSVHYLLNGSGTTRSYLAPDGSTRQLGHNRVALWAGTTLLFDNVPRTFANPALTDLRVRFGAPDSGTWRFDNFVISNELPAPGTLAVTRFTLIDADADQPISQHDPLIEDAVVDLGTLPTNRLTVQAHTYPLTVGSVRFRLDGANVQTENVVPYALAGDNNGNFNAGTPTIGVHTLTATPFSGSGGTGTAGTPLTINFVLGMDPRSSLAITDSAILDGRFSLQRLMDYLVSTSGVSGVTSLQLFQQWWDTQNPAPGLGLGPHCTDNGGTLNTFPHVCRPADGPGAISGEGSQALINPFTGDKNTNRDFYVPIGLFNRFDLAPVDGSHCGEYRLIYARAGASDDTHPDTTPPLPRRNLLIFEAALPNPQPALGLEGCRPVVEFWANLSRLDAATRAAELERFYFAGIGAFAAAANFAHFGTRSDKEGRFLGQVRTNQFLQTPWLLRQFRLVKNCQGGPCTLKMVPDTVKPNPFGPLFGLDSESAHPRTGDFHAYFPSEVGKLSANDVNKIGMLLGVIIEDRFNAAGSPNALNMTLPPFENNYASQFQVHGSTSSFRAAIQSQIPSGSGLTPEHIVLRAQALSCAGCHQLNNGVAIGGELVWPSSNTFVHVSELAQEGGRFSISPALTNVFLPHRRQVLEDFLNGTPAATQLSFRAAISDSKDGKKPPQVPVPTLGGSTTH